MNALAMYGDTCIHVLGTAVHKTDLMHILQGEKGVVSATFRAIIDYDTHETLMFPFHELMDKKTKMCKGSAILFDREYQNNLVDDATAIVKEAWLQYYVRIPSDERVTSVILAVDPAVGLKTSNDFTAYAVIVITELKNYYIVHIDQERVTFNDNIERMKKLAERFKIDTMRLEAISAFKGLAQLVRQKTNLPLKEISSVKDKISRFQSISHLFENGKVFINEAIRKEIKIELIEQLLTRDPVHDDIRDSVVLGLEHQGAMQFWVGVC